jgi:hypothetical protein
LANLFDISWALWNKGGCRDSLVTTVHQYVHNVAGSQEALGGILAFSEVGGRNAGFRVKVGWAVTDLTMTMTILRWKASEIPVWGNGKPTRRSERTSSLGKLRGKEQDRTRSSVVKRSKYWRR